MHYIESNDSEWYLCKVMYYILVYKGRLEVKEKYQG